jgi:hypothetical protein
MSGGSIIEVQIDLDKYLDRYDRQVYTLSKVLQDIGGFKTAILFIGYAIYANILNSMQYFSIVSDLFQVRPDSLSSKHTSAKRKARLFDLESSQVTMGNPAKVKDMLLESLANKDLGLFKNALNLLFSEYTM